MEKDPYSIAPGDTTITLTDGALRNLENMYQRCWHIEAKFGNTHDYTLKARQSLLDAMSTIFRWPGKVFAEDDLSLIIQSRITIGVIWHPSHINGQRDELVGSWSCHS